MALSFIFDASKETPQSLAKKRMVAEALAGRSRAPQNIGEGLTALGEAIGYRMTMADVEKGEAAGREHAAATMAPLLGAGTFPDAPHTTGAPGAGATVTGGSAPDMSGNQIYSEFMDTVKKGGVDNPYALAAIASTGKAESGFSPGNVYRTWSDPSESGQAGKAGGIMSWRAERLAKMQQFAAANGGDPNKPSPALQAQFLLQEDPNLIASLQGAKSADEAQRLMNNAWKFAGYDRPGGEAGRRMAMANSFASQFAGAPSPSAPVQVASLDPSAGVAEATRSAVPPMPDEYATTGLSPAAWERMNAPNAPAAPAKPVAPQPAPASAAQRVMAAMMSREPMGGTPAPMQPFAQVSGALAKADSGQPAAPTATPATKRVAQAMGGGAEAYRGTAVDSDMPGHAPLQAGEAGPSVQQLMQAASDPWLSEQQRGMVNMMLEQKMQAADPIRRLQLQKLQKDLGTPQKQWQKLDDSTLFDPATGEIKTVAPSNGSAGKFRFEGKSVEAQALNGLMDSNLLTEEQAQQLGAGKTISGPNGEIIFMTPQGVFGQAAPGAPAMPITPQTTPAPSPMPAPDAPANPAPAPTGAPAPAAGQRPGMIQVTDPKPQKPTEAQRNRSSNVDQAFSTITNELDRYAELVGKTGIEAMPGESRDNLNTVRQGIMLQMKELFNLGVLNGPDLSLMERMIYDPVIDPLKEGGLANVPDQLWTATTGGAGDRAKNSVAELKRMLTNIKDSVGKSMDQPGSPTPTGSPAPTGSDGWKDMGNGVKIRVKQ